MLAIVRILLAFLLAIGPLPVEARETTFDALSFLFKEYTGPIDQTAAEAPPSPDSPSGAGLAQVQADISLMAEGFETFRHPSHTEHALGDLPDKVIPELRPFFKDRDSSLDTLYRTLAVIDYTWASRFPEPPCDPSTRRRALLSSKDGLFADPKTGETSPWLSRLLGPAASDRSAEAALDEASDKQGVSPRDYEVLRLKVRKISEALESEKAIGPARSKLYCARAQAFEDLSAAHLAGNKALINAGRDLGGKSAPSNQGISSVLLMAKIEGPDHYRALGAGVLVETANGPRVLTAARLVPEGGEDKLRGFARPQDGKTLGAPIPFLVEKIDQRTGTIVGRLEGGEDIPALMLADTQPAMNDLVRAIGHMTGTGAWTVSQGLVTAIGQGAFATDALLGPEMLGGPILNEQGEVAGLAVLPLNNKSPAAVMAAPLRDILSNDQRAADIKFVESLNHGTASLLSATMPTFGAGLTAPSSNPIEASDDIYSQTPWGTVRGTCVANCGGGSSSPSSSYDSGGAELGRALGKALAPVVEALIFKGIPALFRKIGSALSKPKTATVAPLFHSTPAYVPLPSQRHEAVPEPVKEKPKDPPYLTGLTFEVSPNRAATGEKVTLTAHATVSDPDASKADIVVHFKATPETLLTFDGKAEAPTDASGTATVVATLRRDHGVRRIKSGDTNAVKMKADAAQSALDAEVRAMNQDSSGTTEPEIDEAKEEDIDLEASANFGRSLTATALLTLAAVSASDCEIDASAVISVTNDRINAPVIKKFLKSFRYHVFVSDQAYSELAIDPRNLATLQTYSIERTRSISNATEKIVLPGMISVGLESPGDAEIAASAVQNNRRLMTQDSDFLK